MPPVAPRLWSRRRIRSGQALVELALILPIMLTLLLATVDLGRLFYSQITVTNAAREGAIEASQDPTSYAQGTCNATTSKVVCAAVNEARNSFVTVSPADVSLACTPSCTKAYGTKARVTVTGHFSLLTPLMSVFTGGSDITLGSTADADVIIVPAVAGAPRRPRLRRHQRRRPRRDRLRPRHPRPQRRPRRRRARPRTRPSVTRRTRRTTRSCSRACRPQPAALAPSTTGDGISATARRAPATCPRSVMTTGRSTVAKRSWSPSP